MRAALSFLGLVLLAGCGSPEPSVLENEARETQTAATMRGWDRAFATPREAIGRVNQFGFRASDYAKNGATFLSQGNPITLSQSDAKSPNTGNFEAAGANADQIDRFVFTLHLTDAANADTAKQRFVDVLRGFLSQYELKDDGAFDAILKEQSVAGPILAGTPGSIAVTGDAGDRTITVTFTRPATTTPTFPDQGPDQGQADGNRA